MKYDDASWHCGGQFPADLPQEAGGTHTAMFCAWAMLAGLGGDLHAEEPLVESLRERAVTPGQFFFRACDGKFTDEDLSEEGNAFTREYFDFDSGRYLQDYQRVLASSKPSLYHVPDTWEEFDRLRPVLDARLEEWRVGLPSLWRRMIALFIRRGPAD